MPDPVNVLICRVFGAGWRALQVSICSALGPGAASFFTRSHLKRIHGKRNDVTETEKEFTENEVNSRKHEKETTEHKVNSRKPETNSRKIHGNRKGMHGKRSEFMET